MTIAYGQKGMSRACKTYTRVVKGPLTFDNRPDLAQKWQPAWNAYLNIPLFWMDGKRTLWEVAALSASELGIKDVMTYFEGLCEYTDFLCDNGFIALT